MPLQDQILPISFAQGVNTKIDNKQLTPGTPSELLNVTFITPQSFKKRDGNVALTKSVLNLVTSDPITISSGVHVADYRNQLDLLSGSTFYRYSEDITKWINVGPANTTKSTSRDISTLVNPSNGPYIAVNAANNTALSIAKSSLNLASVKEWFLVDLNDESIIQSSRFSSPIQAAKLHSIGQNFCGVTVDINEIDVYWFKVTASSGAFTTSGAPLFTIAASPGNSVFTLDSCTDGTFIYFLYQDATNDLILSKYDASFNLITSVTVNPATILEVAPSLFYDSQTSRIWLSYKTVGINSVNYAVYSTALVVVQPITLVTGFGADANVYVSMTIGVASTKAFIIVSRGQAGLPISRTCYGDISAIGSATIEGYSIASKFIVNSNNNLMLLTHWPSVLQPTYFWTEITYPDGVVGLTSTYIARVAPLAASTAVQSGFSEIAQFDGQYLIGTPFLLNESQLNGTSFTVFNNRFSYLDLSPSVSSTNLANNLNISSGFAYAYDGAGVFNLGFGIFPEVPTTTTPTAGVVPIGTYSYIAVYSFIDNTGNTHRSAPSLPVQVVVAAPQKNNIVVNRYPFASSYQANLLFIELYRTENAGTVYYLVNTINGGTGSGTITISDNLLDSAIIGNRQLYTTGGEVENIAPPPFNLQTSYKNRLVVVDSENPLNWWFSKQVIQGSPVEFSDLFVQAIDQRGGPISALSTMDDKLIFFKSNLIFYVSGDGPTPAGTNNDFSYPQVVSTDVGCANQSSVVLLPIGLMFQSSKGIYLLDRGMQTSYIGQNVEAYNSLRITSAKIVSNTTQVRFTLEDDKVLVYDYLVNQWSVFSGLAFVDSVIYDGKLHGLKSDGTVFAETEGHTTDNGTVIPMKFKSGWINLSGIQGYQRVREMLLLGESSEVTALQVSFAYDFEDLDVQDTVIDITEAEQPTEYRVYLARQKSESLRITIQDTPVTPSNGIVSLSAMTLEVAVKKGLGKTSAAKSYG